MIESGTTVSYEVHADNCHPQPVGTTIYGVVVNTAHARSDCDVKWDHLEQIEFCIPKEILNPTGKVCEDDEGTAYWLCLPCLEGSHFSYGEDHREAGDPLRRDCKTTTTVAAEVQHCACCPELCK